MTYALGETTFVPPPQNGCENAVEYLRWHWLFIIVNQPNPNFFLSLSLYVILTVKKILLFSWQNKSIFTVRIGH